MSELTIILNWCIDKLKCGLLNIILPPYICLTASTRTFVIRLLGKLRSLKQSSAIIIFDGLKRPLSGCCNNILPTRLNIAGSLANHPVKE